MRKCVLHGYVAASIPFVVVALSVACLATVALGQAPEGGKKAEAKSEPAAKPEGASKQESEDAIPNLNEHPYFKKVTEAFPEPAGARRMLSENKGRLWVDPKNKQVIVDGYVTLERGPLELFACSSGTKEHEAVVGVFAPARFIHAALLAVGANPGHPVKHTPEYIAAAGQRIGIELQWKDAAGKEHKVDAKDWVRHYQTKQPLDVDWVFAGSGWWSDETTSRQFYMADSGDVICVSNFTSAMLDLPVESTAQNGDLLYEVAQGKVPPRETPVRLILKPMPDRIPGKAESAPAKPEGNPSVDGKSKSEGKSNAEGKTKPEATNSAKPK